MPDASRTAPPRADAAGPARGRRHARVRVAAVALGLAVAIIAALVALDVGGSARPVAVPVAVSIDLRRPGAPVPREFLGLSFELSSLGQVAHLARAGPFAAMLRSLGPGVLRFGGVSADTRVAWTDAATPLPAWASAGLRASELRDLHELAQKSGWHVLLTIGLAHYDPTAAAREAAAAKAALGGWLAGIEVGNEPDAYARHGLRSEPWTFSRYNAQVAAYREAIARVAPGLALAGPDVSGSLAFESWGRRLALHEKPALLTGHHYPLGCHDSPAPTIGRLLDPRVRRMEDVSLRRYMSVSRASAIGFRLDETNSVSCGGKAGVSNTFASALWAADYLARAMAAGVVGVNLQGAPGNCRGYSPVCARSAELLAEGAVSAQPEWYALLLAKALVGDRPIRTTTSPTRPNLDVLALLDGPRLHVLIVDDDPHGSSATTVSLHTGPAFGAAKTLSLTAPSPAATSGILLGGRAVAPDGTWRAAPERSRRADRLGVITLTVSPGSATLLTMQRSRGPRG
jgi:hypothetical protein